MHLSEEVKHDKETLPVPNKTDPEKTSGDPEDSIEDIPQEFEEVLKGAPPEVRKAIIQMASFRSSGPIYQSHPLFQKFNHGHIDKLLDYGHKDDENSFELEKSSKKYTLTYVCLAIGLLIFLVVYLANDNKELLTDILKILVVFAGGFGSGFGFKSYLDKKRK
jgi:hypothetical protein